MTQLLRSGQTVRGRGGSIGTIDRLLGAGGQGEVYRAVLAGREVAIKWYFRHTATDAQRAAVEALVQKGPPDGRFLWPQDVLDGSAPGFGYAMPLRSPEYAGLIDLMMGKVDPSFRALCTTGYQLAESFLKLHSRGLSYRDISFGNVFFRPDTGDVLICDNDNVGVDTGGVSGVVGTPRFMAPEVVRGEARPSTATDLWSLSVLLFYLLMVHHPLEGRREAAIKCLDLPAMTRLYGSHPLFIFHPDDTSNRPVPGHHDNALAYWPLYPERIRTLFTRTFVDGLDDPLSGRVRESEWRGAMLGLRDSIMVCQQCGAEVFYDAAPLKRHGRIDCWSCAAATRLPFRMRIGSRVVMLNPDTELFQHHIDSAQMGDGPSPVAAVTRHPTNPSILGLKNLGRTPWSVTTGDGSTQTVDPGRSVRLANGTAVNFGPAVGQVRE